MEDLLLPVLPAQAALLALPAVIVALFAVQYLGGFQLLPLHGSSFKRVHGLVALLLGAAFVAHGFGPLTRLTNVAAAFEPMVLPLGIALIVLLGAQVLVGYHFIPTHRAFIPVHVTLATLILFLGLSHGVGIATGREHPPGRACDSCHRVPAAHFTAPCADCHRRPGVAWSFDTHPRIDGPHSYRSFACARCHPNGEYTRVYCSCHGGHPPGEGGGGED